MKITRRPFYDALKQLSRVADQRAAMPVLNHVLLEAKDDTLKLTATDLNKRLTCQLPAEGKLTACLPTKLLANLVKPESRRDKGDVSLEALPDNKFSVEIAGLATILNGIDPNDFPIGEEADLKLLAMWPAKDLDASLAFVLPAYSCDVTRPNLNSVFFNGGTVTTTDGHRLHQSALPGPLDTSLLVPAAVANTLHHILSDGDHVVIARAGENIRFGVGIWQLDARLMDERFPDTEQVIPEKNSQPTKLKLDTKVFTKALTRVAKLSSGQGVKFTVNGSLVLSSQDVDTGSAETEVPVLSNTHAGPDLAAGFNVAFLLDALRKSGDFVELGFSDDLSPMRIDREDGRLAIVMPLRI